VGQTSSIFAHFADGLDNFVVNETANEKLFEVNAFKQFTKVSMASVT
jgi:hypothetical protein